MKVTVLVTTYNHEKYIAQALDSVLMQKTNFDYKIIIGEDCSTDRTRSIVVDFQRRNPRKIRLLLPRKNLGCGSGNRIFAQAFESAQSQYVALLDGDDYWISPTKLQRQADFLDDHPECALCFHNAIRIYEDSNRAPLPYNLKSQKPVSVLEDIWRGNFIAGCAAMFRKDALGNFPEWYYALHYGDWPLYILCAQHGNIGYLDEILGVYRVHGKGLWSGLNSVQKLEGLIAFYQTMNANLNFRFNHIVEPLVSARRKELAIARSLVKIGRKTLPPGVVVIVMSKAYDDLPSLAGHQVWAFPDRSGRQAQRHFASGSAGSAEAPWIGAGGVYEFRLSGGATQNKLLASVTVAQNATGFYPPLPGAEARKNGAFIEASPNPVPTGTKSGKTTITWSTGDGSQGLIHVAVKNLQMHYPADGGEAIKQLKAFRAKGGEFLLIPCEHFSWLEEYVGLKEHLDSHYALIQDDEICRIYDLRKVLSKDRSGGAAG
jgi:glycosyltransferase involved in cell wall biosynthesis